MKQRVDTEFDESRVVSARRGSAHRRKAATALLVGGVLCGGLANAQEADQMPPPAEAAPTRSEEHTYELQSLMRNPYAVFCLKKKKKTTARKKKQLGKDSME